jgi:hypothetical protein
VFARSIKSFDDYYRIADANRLNGFSAPLGGELRERLQQMDWLLGRVESRERGLSAITKRHGDRFRAHIEDILARGLSYEDVPIPTDIAMSREDGRRIIDLMFEIRIFAECFYYFAARARSIARAMPRSGSCGLRSGRASIHNSTSF